MWCENGQSFSTVNNRREKAGGRQIVRHIIQTEIHLTIGHQSLSFVQAPFDETIIDNSHVLLLCPGIDSSREGL